MRDPAPATNAQIKEIYFRNASFERPLPESRRKKTVGLAVVYLDELDALLERLRIAEHIGASDAG